MQAEFDYNSLIQDQKIQAESIDSLLGRAITYLGLDEAAGSGYAPAFA